MLKHSIRSLRVSLAAIGLLASLVVPAAFAQSADHDPLGRPIWQDAAQQTTVVDSLPTRLKRFQLLSFPLVPSPNTVSGIFDELGGYNPSVYRLGHWLPSLAGPVKYQEPNAFTTIEPGLGYWLITRDSTTVRYNGTAAPGDTIELPLIQGPNGVPDWNQLGNPFNFNSAVGNWRVVKRDSLLTLVQAANRNWIDGNMRTWNPDAKQFSASGTIPRGQGFFARLTDRDTALVWTRWPVEAFSSNGYFSSVALDSKGNPHIAFYRDGSQGELRYSTRKGNAWTTIRLDNTSSQWVGFWASIALDSLDLPHIAYMAYPPSPVGKPMYIRQLPNGTWTIPEQIDPGSNNGWLVKIKLFHGQPRVAFVNGATARLRYAEKTVGGWIAEDASALVAGNLNIFGGTIGFDLDQAGRPHIAGTSTNSPFALRYVTKNGTTWSSEVVDTLVAGSTGITPSLALDAAGVPHISYFDQQNNDLRYARKSGTTWIKETVDATGNTGQFSSIRLRASGEPTITFIEFTSSGVPNRVRFAQRSGGSWPIETVDDVDVSGFAAYLGSVLDSDGNPSVSYQAVPATQELRFAEKTRGDWRIKIPPVAAPEPPAATLAKPAGAEWAVAITPWQGDRSAEPLMLGAAAPGTELSAIKSAAAPAPPGEHVLSLAVVASDGNYVRDFQPSASTLRWSFQTAGGESPGEQTLDFTGLDLPKGMRLFLSDPESGWTKEVSDGQRVTVAARPRTLEFSASLDGSVEAQSPADRLAFAYPNPFTASTGLAFTLARPAEIRVDILDVMGRRVRTLTRNAATAGEHVLVWDGRGDDGRAAPSGVYLANYRAGDAHGSRRLVRVE